MMITLKTLTATAGGNADAALFRRVLSVRPESS